MAGRSNESSHIIAFLCKRNKLSQTIFPLKEGGHGGAGPIMLSKRTSNLMHSTGNINLDE